MDARYLLDDLESKETVEIYIHFYTLIYKNNPNRLSIYWYKNTSEHVEVFQDVKLIFEKMKECHLITTYTGDIFCIRNENVFVEKLLLLGVKQTSSYSLHLINGRVKEVHCGRSDSASTFNDLFDICFQSYDMYQSFSSSDEEHLITLLDKRATSGSEISKEENQDIDYADKHLLIIDFFGHQIITTFIKLRTIVYSIFHSIIDNQTLNRWFRRLIEKNQYDTIVQTIHTMETFHREHPYEDKPQSSSPSLYDDSSEEEKGDDLRNSQSEKTKREEDPKEWIQLFCDLYLQKDSDHDILLSEVYQDYCTSSAWSSTPTVSMALWIKTLRSLKRFTIRRRSKGMMIVGYRSLVSQQKIFYERVKNGQEASRNILHFLTVKEIREIILGLSSSSPCLPLERDTHILLPRLSIPVTPQVIRQFHSIPYLVESLPLYATYINQILAKPLHLDIASDLADFRELKQICVLYYPFSVDIQPSTQEDWKIQPMNEHIRAYNDPPVLYSNPMHEPMVEEEQSVEKQFS